MESVLEGRFVMHRCTAVVLWVGVFSTAGVFAQTLEEKRDKKLAGPWLKKANWTTDYAKAKAESERTGKVIFAYFTRSYAR